MSPPWTPWLEILQPCSYFRKLRLGPRSPHNESTADLGQRLAWQVDSFRTSAPHAPPDKTAEAKNAGGDDNNHYATHTTTSALSAGAAQRTNDRKLHQKALLSHVHHLQVHTNNSLCHLPSGRKIHPAITDANICSGSTCLLKSSSSLDPSHPDIVPIHTAFPHIRGCKLCSRSWLGSAYWTHRRPRTHCQ